MIARGLILDGDGDTAMVLGSGETDLEVAFCCEGEEGASSSTAPELPNTLGAQSTVVLLVNFADDTSQPFTVAEAQDMVFGQVSDYFYEASYNKTWLEGEVYGWLTMELSTSTCSFSEVTAAAEQAASDAGIDLSLYDRRLFITPRDTNCAFAGVAEIGGGRAWMNGYLGVQVITHEVGHNFGLRHAHAYDCGDVSLGPDCTNRLYGDTTDTLGGPDEGHYNPFFKQRLGWAGDGAAEEVEAVASDGVYVVEPYETAPGSQPKALKIPAGVDSATGSQKWLYVSYRQAIGFDSFYDNRS